MNIRRAEEKDIDKILDLLSQVLEIHAAIRPDLFISGTTKYPKEELLEIIHDDQRPIYVAVDERDLVLGYAFCAIRHQPERANLVQFKYLYIDDLCVDQAMRRQHIAGQLFEFVKKELPKDVIVYIIMHDETDDYGNTKLKMLGKLLEQKVCVEGMVTIVIRCMCDEDRHYFRVTNNGADITKAPEDMFGKSEMDNDLKQVDSIIREYYGLKK